MSRVILGDIAISQTGPFGSQLHEEDYVSEGTPIVTVEHLGDINFTHQNLPFVSEADTKRLSKYILIEGDIVFSRVGSIDRNVYVDKNHEGWMFSGRCIRVRADKNKVNTRYLSYYFKQNSFKKMMMNLAVGATMPSLNTKIMNSIELDLLPRENQDKIANILSAIDDKIQINNQINQELEAMAKTLYDYWFVQFDFPDQNGKPYKSSGGKMVYHPELKREIPEGWGVETLKDFESKIITGKTPSRANSDNFGGEIPFITIGDIRGNTFIYNTSETLTDLGASVQQNKYLPEGSLCVSCIATVGEIGFTTEWSHTNQQINSIVFEDETNRYYLYFALKNYFENANASAKTGNTFANMNKEDFSGIRIILPRNEIKNNFHKMTEPYFAQIKCLQGQNKELTQLRDWLLPMLMNGQVKVE
ncbi:MULTISPECIES: restriction endonuclease subunit S [Streptococcus mitis group]|uniref:Type I restriction modification DNA specificity domain protein n=1 Tax=Streptococcus mitis TaxID=28037 RepID=A0A081PNE2_STRMT|nr:MULTISPECIES: restriction endonuclease subunit S [Streptococcus]KEQ32215.1 type I restriction modification DNA specificity domain protein [Streptococcus mitis]MDB0075304.1 restriction endonuclease subunit S [Streptococcus gwangjuense]